jgi:acetyltransferase-like isoleucine patch superfamily enzyme
MILIKLFTIPGSCCRIKSFLLNLRLGYLNRFRVIIYPRTKVRLAGSAKLVVDREGKLQLGATWPMTNYNFSTLKIDECAEVIVHGDFSFRTGIFLSVNKGARLEIGSGRTNRDVDITCFNSIKIGNNVLISKGVMIRDSDSHTIIKQGYCQSKPIVIGNNVWIGMRAVILKGVTIGEGSIVAAGAVVTKDIPPHTVAGGVPARVIRENVTWN